MVKEFIESKVNGVISDEDYYRAIEVLADTMVPYSMYEELNLYAAVKNENVISDTTKKYIMRNIKIFNEFAREI